MAHSKFYKEIGRWNAALEEVQNKKIAHLEKVQKRWDAFAEEAQGKMAKTGKKIDVGKEWRDIVEKEIGLLPYESAITRRIDWDPREIDVSTCSLK